MGNRLGRPRRGLPERARALKPGAALSDVRDRDVVVLCADGAPLRLDVVADDGSPLGERRGGDGPRDAARGRVSFALCPGTTATLADASSRVVVDARGPWVTFRSVVAGDHYLCVDDDGSVDSSETTTNHPTNHHPTSHPNHPPTLAGAFPALVRFRHRRHVPRLGLWSWSYDAPADAVVFSSKSDPRVRCLAVGPARSFSRADAARRWTETLRDERDVLGAVAKALGDLEAEARDVASEALGRLEAMKRHLEREIARERRRAATKGLEGELGFLDGLTGVVDALRDQVKGASAEPIGPTERDEEEEEEDEEESAAVMEKDVVSKGGARRRVAFEDGRGGEGARASTRRSARKGVSGGWRAEIDSAHLATVSRLWDSSVADFRGELEAHGVDAKPLADLQEAIQSSAYEHFVAQGMRRYLLNEKEKTDEGRDDDERSVSDAAYGSETESFFSESDDVSASAASPSRKGGSTRWASQVSEDAARLARARRARARRRAELKARVRAGEAAVDFRRHKVGSLREQLERQGVDAGPLATLVHVLAREFRARRSARERRLGLGSAVSGFAAKAPSEASLRAAESKAGEAFRAALRKDALGSEMDFVRREALVERAKAQPAPALADAQVRVADAMRSPEKRTQDSGGSDARAEEGGGDDSSALSEARRSAIRLAASAAASAAGLAQRELERTGPNGARAGRAMIPAAALAVMTFAGAMRLDDFRRELELRSLLAGGLDECVDALVETEWEGGDDGFIGAEGERAAGIFKTLTVDAFRARLVDHGLEGSILELDLLVDALAAGWVEDERG